MSLYLWTKRLLKVIWASVWRLGHSLERARVREPACPKVRILFYHRVSMKGCTRGSELEISPEVLAQHLEILRAGQWRVVPLSVALRLLREGMANDRGHREARPDQYVVITFDDGYRDNVTRALPILRRHGVPAAFFVTTGFVGTEQPYPWVMTSQEDPESLPLDWREISQLRAAGCEVHSHGVTHRDLRELTKDEVLDELNNSKESILRHTGALPVGFCYPSGHLTPVVARLTAEAGYELACTCRPGLNDSRTPLHELRRTAVQTSDTLSVFRAKLDGAFDWGVPPLVASLLKRVLLAMEDLNTTITRRGNSSNAGTRIDRP